MTRLSILSVTSVAILMGCATDKGKSLRLQLGQGVGGYTGAVRPIHSPVRIKIGPVRSWRVEGVQFTKNVDGSEHLVSMSMSGDTIEDDKNFLRTVFHPTISQMGTIRRQNYIIDDIQLGKSCYGNV